MPRKISSIAPDWWDYTTLDSEIIEDAARLFFCVFVRRMHCQLLDGQFAQGFKGDPLVLEEDRARRDSLAV